MRAGAMRSGLLRWPSRIMAVVILRAAPVVLGAQAVPGGYVVEGRVSAGGAPVADARVELSRARDGGRGAVGGLAEAAVAIAVTDAGGRYRLTSLPSGEYTLSVRRLGHAPASRRFGLGPERVVRADVTLAPLPVELGATVTSATLREVLVGDAPVKVEVLTSAFLRRNATSNLMDNLSFVNGLNQQVDCGVCFTNNIRMNGMEGPYTAVLVDGAPIMSALATVYALNSLDPAIVEQVEIVRGPSSTLHGSEAMGGVINVVTRDPRLAPRWSVSAATSSHGEHTTALAGSARFGKVSALTSVNAAHNELFVDGNDDGFSDLPRIRRLSVFSKWAVGDAADRSLDLAGRIYMEDRAGSERGWTRADRGTERAYGEYIRTRRAELVGSYRFPRLDGRLRLDAAFNHHDQESWYGVQPYMATQSTAFAQLVARPAADDRHDVTVGATLRAQVYDDSTRHQQTHERRLVPGLFAQDELSIGERWTLLGGLRMDHHDAHGLVYSPRLAVKWDADLHTTVRLNAATGFRVVSLFTEDHQALSGARDVVIEEELRPERSYTITASVNRELDVRGVPDAMTLDVDLYHTHFTDRIVADYDSDPGLIVYGNLDGWARTRGIAVAAGYRTLQRPFYANVGVTVQEVVTSDGGVRSPLPYAPGVQGVFTLGYQFVGGRLAMDWTGRVLGPMALPHFDGFPGRSPWFSEHHLQATFQPRAGMEIYGAVKNLFDLVQRDAIIAPHDPFGPDFDTGRVYAPLQGRRMQLGARWTVGR